MIHKSHGLRASNADLHSQPVTLGDQPRAATEHSPLKFEDPRTRECPRSRADNSAAKSAADSKVGHLVRPSPSYKTTKLPRG